MKFYSILYVAAIVLFLSNCESPLELELPKAGERLVFASAFSNKDFIGVQVSVGRSVFDTSQNLNLKGGVPVQIFADGDYVEDLELVFDEELDIPVYTSSFIPAPGITYAVQADIPGQGVVKGTSSIPEPTPIDVLTLENVEILENEDRSRRLYLFSSGVVFPDIAGEENFYHLKIFQDVHTFRLEGLDTIITETRRIQVQFDPDFNINDEIASFEGGILLTDNKFDGLKLLHEYGWTLSIDGRIQSLGMMFFELRTVSREYFKYYSSFSRQFASNQSDPFLEPVILYDNIENGLGFFAGYSTVTDSIAMIP